MKKIQLNVKSDIYEQYQELCRSNDTSVAVAIRDMMKNEVTKSKATYVNEKHKKLDKALNAIREFASVVDDDKLSGDIMGIGQSLMIATLDKLN